MRKSNTALRAAAGDRTTQKTRRKLRRESVVRDQRKRALRELSKEASR